jgi:hypothetical protein
MAVCAPEGFRLALAAEIAELGEASSLDVLQEIHSRSLVDELERTTRRYRLHALVREAASAVDSQRRKHAGLVRMEFKDWENGWRQCEMDMADWQAAFLWSLGQAGDEETWVTANKLAYLGCALTLRLEHLDRALGVFRACEWPDRAHPDELTYNPVLRELRLRLRKPRVRGASHRAGVTRARSTGLVHCCKVLPMRRGNRKTPESEKGQDSWTAEFEAKQRNLVWPRHNAEQPGGGCPLLQRQS